MAACVPMCACLQLQPARVFKTAPWGSSAAERVAFAPLQRRCAAEFAPPVIIDRGAWLDLGGWCRVPDLKRRGITFSGDFFCRRLVRVPAFQRVSVCGSKFDHDAGRSCAGASGWVQEVCDDGMRCELSSVGIRVVLTCGGGGWEGLDRKWGKLPALRLSV